jgi:TetR/AcrR family transcriptional regulator, transcriptional repressor of bet genes
LLEAMMRIAHSDGWDAVSLRKVAAEGGVSMGMVQHYFTTKDEMLRFAIEMMAEDTRQRIRRRVADLPDPPTPRLLVETVLLEMIPDSRRRPTEAEAAKVWIRRFLLRPESQAVLREGTANLRASLTEQILLGRPGDRAAAERDADILIVLLDGLILNIAIGQQTAETATAILTAQLDLTFR